MKSYYIKPPGFWSDGFTVKADCMEISGNVILFICDPNNQNRRIVGSYPSTYSVTESSAC